MDHEDAVRSEAGRPDREQLQVQLARLENRLVAELGGTPETDALVRQQLVKARATFADAQVTRYLPILIERAVRVGLPDG